MTQAIQINVPENAKYEVLVVQWDKLQDGSEVQTNLLPMKPGSNNTIHIWDTRSVAIKERPISSEIVEV